MRFIVLLVLIWAVTASATPDTIHVPDDYAKIQQAINAASHLDTVLVAPGIYYENLDFQGKHIIVKSAQGAVATVIDGRQQTSVVRFMNHEGSDSVIDGFTLTNGFGYFQQVGIYQWCSGGAIFCRQASPAIRNNIIMGNKGDFGRGICVDTGSPVIENNYITCNAKDSTGHGGLGGGIYLRRSSSLVINNTLTFNSACRGGGIYCMDSTPVIKNNLIAGNRSSGYLAGRGGGVFLQENPQIELSHNTITGNFAAIEGGGMHCNYGSFPEITDCILWDNEAPQGPEMWIGGIEGASSVTIRYSDVKGGMGSVHVVPGSNLDWGLGMLDTDPLFIPGPVGKYYLSHVAAGQAEDSPCIDSGSDKAQASGLDACWTRTDEIPDSGMVDLGFHHGPFPTPSLHVDRFGFHVSHGGEANFHLFGGKENAGREYLLLAGAGGTTPGTSLPNGNMILPLNWDPVTDLIIGSMHTPLCMNFFGTLDFNGSAEAVLNLPGFAAPIPFEVVIHFAFCLRGPFDFVSNATAIEIAWSR